MVEHAAVNRVVVGSSPTSGANVCLMYWVYILQNPGGRFYIGQTGDLQARLANHNRSDHIVSYSCAAPDVCSFGVNSDSKFRAKL